MIGQTILGYTIKEEIGSGAFSTVYRCEKTDRTGVYVRALKHISIPTKKQYQDILNSMGGDYVKANEYFSSSLQDIIGEIRILNHLTEIGAQNVVFYYENHIDEQTNPLKYDIYILMEYLTAFSEYVEKNDISVRDVIRLGKNILTALEICHNNQIIHRDIKDDNIFVGNDGIFKLGDFGVSKKLQDRFVAESMKGTLSYIAPEVYLKTKKYDHTVDLYSLGIVLYKLLNGNRIPFLPAFPALYNNMDEELAFERRMNYEIPDLPVYAENELGQTILKAVTKREKRYNSAREFYMALCETEKHMTNGQLNQIVINGRKEDGDPFVQHRVVEGTVGAFSEIVKDEFVVSEEEYNDLFDQQVHKENDGQQKKVEKEDSFDIHSVWDRDIRKNDLKVKEESADDIKHIFEPEIKQGDKQEYRFSDLRGEREQRPHKNNSDLVFYLMPIGIAFVYILIYMVYLPHVYDNTVSIADWIIKNPKEVMEKLQFSGNVFPSLYKTIFWKLLNYIFYAGFIASLYALGRKIQNSKPAQSTDAVLKDREAYYMIMESYEEIKQIPSIEKEVYNAVKKVHDRLRNESGFGYGGIDVIRCENEIEELLNMISSDIARLNSQNKDMADTAKQEIISACQRIMTKLKVRAELKKK